MATVIFSIVNSITSQVSVDGASTFKPRNMVPAVNGNEIRFAHPYNVNYDFIIYATDTITAEGSPVTGTPDEIATAIANAVFFEESAGGAVEGLLVEEGAWTFGAYEETTDKVLAVVNAIGGVEASAQETNGGKVFVYADVATVSVRAYPTSTGDPSNDGKGAIDFTGGPAEIRSSDSLSILIGGSLACIIPSGGIQDYADDAAAATGGVPVNGLYHTSGTLKIRLT